MIGAFNKPQSIPMPLRYPGCVLWLDGQDPNGNGIIPANNASITSWVDKSGLGNNAITVANHTNPLYAYNAINGYPALAYNGTDSGLAANNSSSLAIAGDLTVFCVIKQTDFSAVRGLVSKCVGFLPASYDLYTLNSTGLLRFYRGANTNGVNVTSTIAPPANTPHVISVTQAVTAVNMYYDTLSAGSGTISTTQGDGGQPLYIGARIDGLNIFKGSYGEVLLYNRAFSTTDKSAMMAWLGQRWGIIAS